MYRELLPKRIQNFPEPSYASKDHDRLDNRLAAYGLKEKKVSLFFIFVWGAIRMTSCFVYRCGATVIANSARWRTSCSVTRRGTRSAEPFA